MRLYRKADEVLKSLDPCMIVPLPDGRISCAEGCANTAMSTHLGHGCCQGCPHLGPKGCTVKALGCKVWLCSAVETTPAGKVANKQLQSIRDEMREKLGGDSYSYRWFRRDARQDWKGKS